MSWFFKKNMNNQPSNNSNKWEGWGDIEMTPIKKQTGGKGPNWQYVKASEWFEYLCGIGLVILFCILFWIVLIGLPVLPIITILICIFSGLNYEGIINNKTVGCLTIIKDFFKYYKVSMTSIFSFFVVISAFTNLGTLPGIFAIITIALIYFNIISIDLFKAVSEEGLTPLSSYKQANKSCSNIKQKGGENIIKELKKISKILSNK
jgi:hypothetical protein